MPSEFKVQWETFLKDQVIDAFGDCFSFDKDVIFVIMRVAQKVSIDENRRLYREQIERVRQALGVERTSEVIADLENSLRPFLRNHYKNCLKTS
jgi:hypothetical protein